MMSDRLEAKGLHGTTTDVAAPKGPSPKAYLTLIRDTDRLRSVDAFICDFDGVDRVQSPGDEETRKRQLLSEDVIQTKSRFDDLGIINITITGEVKSTFIEKAGGIAALSRQGPYYVLTRAGAIGEMVSPDATHMLIEGYEEAVLGDQAVADEILEITIAGAKEILKQEGEDAGLVDSVRRTASPQGVTLYLGGHEKTQRLRFKIAELVRPKIEEMKKAGRIPKTANVSVSFGAIDIMPTSKGSSAIQMIKLLGLRRIVLMGDSIGTAANPGGDRSMLTLTTKDLRDAGVDWDVDLIKVYVGHEENAEIPADVYVMPENAKDEIAPSLGMYRAVIDAKTSQPPAAGADHHPFRFPKYIWDRFKDNLLALPDGAAIFHKVKMCGLAWTDPDGTIHFIDEDESIIDKAAAAKVWQAAAAAINKAAHKKISDPQEVKDVIAYHEKVHSLLRGRRYKKLIASFKGKLEDEVFQVTLNHNHFFIKTFQKVYGTPPANVAWNNRVDWCIEELLALSIQERNMFDKPDVVLERMGVSKGQIDKITAVLDAILETETARDLRRELPAATRGNIGEKHNRQKAKQLRDFVKGELEEFNREGGDERIQKTLRDLDHLQGRIRLITDHPETIGYATDDSITINERLFHSEHILPALFYIAGLKHFSGFLEMSPILEDIFEEGTAAELAQAIDRTLARSRLTRDTIQAAVYDAIFRPDGSRTLWHDPEYQDWDGPFVQAMAEYYEQEDPDLLAAFLGLAISGRIKLVRGLNIPNAPGWYDAHNIYINEDCPSPESALTELIRLRTQSLTDFVDPDEEWDVLCEPVGPTNSEAKGEYKVERRNSAIRTAVICAAAGCVLVPLGMYFADEFTAKPVPHAGIDPQPAIDSVSAAPAPPLIERNIPAKQPEERRAFVVPEGERKIQTASDGRASVEVVKVNVKALPLQASGSLTINRHLPLHALVPHEPGKESISSFLPSTQGSVNYARLTIDDKTGKIYVNIRPVLIIAELSGAIARDMFIGDLFPQMADGGKIMRGGPYTIVPQGNPTNEEIRVEIILPPFEKGQKMQLLNVLNGKVYPASFERLGLTLNEQGVLKAEYGTKDYIRLTYTIQRMTENSSIQVPAHRTAWMEKESRTIPKQIKADIENAKKRNLSDREKMEEVALILNKYFAYQTDKIEVNLPEGKTWGEYFQGLLDKHGRVLCDCDVLATYSMICLHELGYAPGDAAVIVGFSNGRDYRRLTGDEAHATLAAKLGDRWVIFEATLYAPLALGHLPGQAPEHRTESQVENLDKAAAESKAAVEANKDRLAKIEQEMERINRDQEKLEAGRGAGLTASTREVAYFQISPELAKRLDRRLVYESPASVERRTGQPIINFIGRGIPINDETDLLLLMELARSQDIDVREAELNSKTLQELLAGLQSRDVHERLHAVAALRARGEVAYKALPALAKLLDDPEGLVRSSVYRTPDRSVSAAAASAIMEIHAPAIVKENIPLLVRLGEYYFGDRISPTRELLPERIGKIREFVKLGEPAVRELADVAKTHPVEETRYFALQMLGYFLDYPEAVRALIETGVSDTGFRNFSLVPIHAKESLKPVESSKAVCLLKALPDAKSENIELLAKFLILNNPYHIFRHSGPGFQSPEYYQAQDELQKRLAAIDKEVVTPRLEAMVLDNNLCEELRVEIVRHLCKRNAPGDTAWQPRLVAMALNRDLPVDMRLEAARQFSRWNNFRIPRDDIRGPSLKQIAQTPTADDIRVLSAVGDKEDVNLILGILQNPAIKKDDVKQAAATAILSFCDLPDLLVGKDQEGQLQLLTDLLYLTPGIGREEYLQRREFAVAREEPILKRLQDFGGQAVPHLLAVLKDAKGNRQLSIARALGRLKANEAIRPITDIIGKEDYGFGKGNFIDVLGAIGTPEAAQVLVSGMKEEKNAFVISYYMRALGMTHRPEAVKPLEEAGMRSRDFAWDALMALKKIEGNEARDAIKRLEAKFFPDLNPPKEPPKEAPKSEPRSFMPPLDRGMARNPEDVFNPDAIRRDAMDRARSMMPPGTRAWTDEHRDEEIGGASDTPPSPAAVNPLAFGLVTTDPRQFDNNNYSFLLHGGIVENANELDALFADIDYARNCILCTLWNRPDHVRTWINRTALIVDVSQGPGEVLQICDIEESDREPFEPFRMSEAERRKAAEKMRRVRGEPDLSTYPLTRYEDVMRNDHAKEIRVTGARIIGVYLGMSDRRLGKEEFEFIALAVKYGLPITLQGDGWGVRRDLFGELRNNPYFEEILQKRGVYYKNDYMGMLERLVVMPQGHDRGGPTGESGMASPAGVDREIAEANRRFRQVEDYQDRLRWLVSHITKNDWVDESALEGEIARISAGLEAPILRTEFLAMLPYDYARRQVEAADVEVPPEEPARSIAPAEEVIKAQSAIHDENLSLKPSVPAEKVLWHVIVGELVPKEQREAADDINTNSTQDNERIRILNKGEDLRTVLEELSQDTNNIVHVVLNDANRIDKEVPKGVRIAVFGGEIGNYVQLEGAMAVSRALDIKDPAERNQRLRRLYWVLTGKSFVSELPATDDPAALARAIIFYMPKITIAASEELTKLNKSLILFIQSA